MPTILVTGASGFLGQYVLELAPPHWTIIPVYHRHVIQEGIALDLTDRVATLAALEDIHPGAILHLAAAANPNACETQPDISRAINVQASKTLSAYAGQRNIPFLFASTDLVFNGEHPPYRPDAQPNPVNQYGRDKALAEKLVLQEHPQVTIARLPLMYGDVNRGQHFLANWYQQLKAGQTIPAFTDEWRTPAHARDVASGLLLLLRQQARGIWHLGGPERCSRYEMGVQLAQLAGMDSDLVRPCLRQDVAMPAARPADVSLDSSESFRIGYQPMDISAGLKQALGL